MMVADMAMTIAAHLNALVAGMRVIATPTVTVKQAWCVGWTIAEAQDSTTQMIAAFLHQNSLQFWCIIGLKSKLCTSTSSIHDDALLYKLHPKQQGPHFEFSRNIVTILTPNHYLINATQGNLKQTLGTLWAHSQSTQWASREHTGSTQGSLRDHSEHTKRTLPRQNIMLCTNIKGPWPVFFPFPFWSWLKRPGSI